MSVLISAAVYNTFHSYKKFGKQFKKIRRGEIMKINWNKKYTTIAIYAIVVIIFAVLFIKLTYNFDTLKQAFSWVGSIGAPIICGIVIAYILNPLMVWLENKIFGKYKAEMPQEQNIVVRKLQQSSVGDKAVVKTLEKHSAPMEKKVRRRKLIARTVSLVLTFIIFLAAITGIAVAIVPNVSKSIVTLAENMDGYIQKIDKWVTNVFESKPEVMESIFKEIKSFQDLLSKIAGSLEPMTKDIIGNLSGFIGNILVGLKNFLLGFIIAIYLLFSKERLMAQMKKIVCAFLKPMRAQGFLHGCSRSNDIFKKYIISNLVDSLIILVFMMIGMFAMGMPYQMLIAVVCAVTNLIPFFGPFLGAIPCGLLILLVDPPKVIWFAIFVLVLQQLDGNVIKPLLFGETMGLPAIWVLISIIVGGAMFGIPGMLLGAPVFAVFYMMFAEYVKNKLQKKNLPGETEVYEANSEVLSDDYLQHASEPGKMPASFEEATKPDPTPQEKELPEPITEPKRPRSRRKRK